MGYFKLLSEISSIKENRDFLIIDEKIYTYDEVYKVSKLLGEKISQIVNCKDLESVKSKVLIYTDSFYFQIVAFFACNFSKCIPIISHFNLPEVTFKNIVDNNNIQCVLTDKKLGINDFNNMECNEEQLENLGEILLYKTGVEQNDIINYKVCMGVLTSGSTDIPKVLYRTYESWADFFKIQNEIFEINSSSRLFVNGSLSFTGNLNSVLSVLYEGGTIISETNFNCKKWIRVINKEKVTNIYLVPAKLKMLNNFLNNCINHVKSIFTGSQLLFENTAYELKEKFPNSKILLYYGASELNYITYLNYEEILCKPLSVGKPFPSIGVFIKDDFIYVNTKYHVEGIMNPCTVHDMGEIDEDGYLIFHGRKDSIINKGGIKVSGIKIENKIRKIDEVNNVAVIGYNHDKKGNEIAAFIVRNKDITKENIIEKLKENLMKVEIPKKIIFVKNIPLNNSGKVDRLKLINEFLSIK